MIPYVPRTTQTTRLISSIVAILLLWAGPAFAQSGTITPSPFQTVFDNNGAIVNGACVWTYVAGTTTPVATYTTNTIGTPNSNPIVADSAGRYTAFLVPGVSYKFVYEQPCVAPAHGAVLRPADQIQAMPASASP